MSIPLGGWSELMPEFVELEIAPPKVREVKIQLIAVNSFCSMKDPDPVNLGGMRRVPRSNNLSGLDRMAPPPSNKFNIGPGTAFFCPKTRVLDAAESSTLPFLEKSSISTNFSRKEAGRSSFPGEESGSSFKPIRPNSSEFLGILRDSNLKNIDSSSTLYLSESKTYCERDFVKSPLFKSSIEKHDVFRELCNLSREDASFTAEYEYFLTKIKSESAQWAEKYQLIPEYLAYLALYAYLDGKINEDELVVVHSLASAFLESADNSDYVVLNQENIGPLLAKYNYLQNGYSFPDFSFSDCFNQKSVLERTAILYRTTKGIDLNIYKLGEQTKNVTLGFKPVEGLKSGCDVAVLPRWLTESIYNELFSSIFSAHQTTPPPTDHSGIFGYRRKILDLVGGRPVTYPSPLFFGPTEVHDVESKQLAIYVHDLLGHCRADWMHPYTNEVIALGLAIREELGEKFAQLSIDLLDRAIEPHKENPAENVANFIKILMKKKTAAEYRKVYTVCEKKLPKEVSDLVLDACKKRHEKEDVIFLLRSK